MYEYRAQVIRVVDGDTIDFEIDVGFHISLRMRVRLRGVDTPEVRGPSRPQGLESAAFVREQLPEGRWVLLQTYKIGKFGRYIADVRYLPDAVEPEIEELRARGLNLADELLERGLAVTIDAS